MTRDTADLSNEGDDAASNLIEGKYAILFVFLLGLLGAVGSWWYHSQLQRQAIAFWGAQNRGFSFNAARPCRLHAA